MKPSKTVQELFEATVAGHWSKNRFKVSGWAKEAASLYNKNVGPVFGHLSIDKLSAKRIRAWHEDFELRAPISGNRSLEVLSKMFKYAEEMEWMPQNANPCALVRRHKEHARKRYATHEELQSLGALLTKEQVANPEAVAFLYLLMFTGSRPRAIERARWDQLKMIEVEGKTYGILSFGGKTGDETVILPPQALSAINDLRRRPDGKILGIKMPRRLWSRIKKEAGCETLWARDLRRTFATLGFSGGLNAGTIGELLNHKSANTTKIYAKLMDTARINAVAGIANQMEGLLKKAG